MFYHNETNVMLLTRIPQKWGSLLSASLLGVQNAIISYYWWCLIAVVSAGLLLILLFIIFQLINMLREILWDSAYIVSILKILHIDTCNNYYCGILTVIFLFPSSPLHLFIRILLCGRFVPFPQFIYLFNYLMVSVWTHGYLFYSEF